MSLQRIRADLGFIVSAFALTLLAGLAAPTAGRAAVTYSFQWNEQPGPSDRSAAFTLVVPRFILGQIKAGADQLVFCSTRHTGATCDRIGLYTDASPFTSAPRDVVEFSVRFASGAILATYFYFADDAFQTPGIYQDRRNSVNAQLTVSGVADSVPEPSTWALLITGFGGAGAMLRRRRPVAAGEGPAGPKGW